MTLHEALAKSGTIPSVNGAYPYVRRSNGRFVYRKLGEQLLGLSTATLEIELVQNMATGDVMATDWELARYDAQRSSWSKLQ